MRCLDHPDGGLSGPDGRDLVRLAADLLAESDPDVVITFGPDAFSEHTDHMAVGAAATAACSELGPGRSVRIFHCHLPAGMFGVEYFAQVPPERELGTSLLDDEHHRPRRPVHVRAEEPPQPFGRALRSPMATRRALLLIADIGGYTQYMQYHRSVLGHAEAATRRMLDKVVGAAKGFDLIEIEGDAAFLSRDADGMDGPTALAAVTGAAAAMHRAFHAERRFVELNLCPCGSCTKTSDLKLKFVAHVGEVATQTIRRRKKLVGLDVIYAHRLLKNTVPLPEYLLVSDDLFRAGGRSTSELVMQECAQDLEGIGQVQAHYADVVEMATPLPPLPDPTWRQRIGGTFGMVGRGLPHVLPRRRPHLAGAAG